MVSVVIPTDSIVDWISFHDQCAAAFAFPEIRTEARRDVSRSADRDAVRLNA